MTYDQAKKILDRTKDGSIYPEWVITTALYLTGDLEFDERNGSTRMVREIPKEIHRSWAERSQVMVEQNYS